MASIQERGRTLATFKVSTLDRLKTLKLCERESYDDVVNRLIKNI